MYAPTWESVSSHPLPDCYDDAKLGIFLHWGLYSVPGWAPQVPDIQQLLKDRGPADMLRDNPYAEWYLNTSRIEGSPTWRHQRDTYGSDATYDDFVAPFDEGTASADMTAIAATCRDAGANYVVLTTKHHDGFCLWPTALPHPRKGRYHAKRDLVGDLAALFADYYNAVADGVINDRWVEPPGHRGAVTDALARVGGTVVQRLWPLIPDGRKSLTFSAAHHYDIRTPEYASFDSIRDKKWESTRGVGHSFGANRNERAEDIVTATELVRSFVDIVSKNGNLLIGIGPDEHGRFPDEQLTPLRGLGQWLRVNGEAVYGSRPWRFAEATTTEGGAVRFTQRDGVVYAVLLDLSAREFGIRGLDARAVAEVRMLGLDQPLTWSVTDGQLHVTMPERMPISPAYVLRLDGGARPAGPADQRGGDS